MDVERRPSRAIQARAGGSDFRTQDTGLAATFAAHHSARVLLAERGFLPDEPPWGADLGGYAERLVVSLGGDPKRHLRRRQPRGVSKDDVGRRIRERVAEDLMLLGATRCQLVPVLGGPEATDPTNISHLLRDARQRRDLRRYMLGPELGEELARIRDPEERKARRLYRLQLGQGIDSTLEDEHAQIEHAQKEADENEERD